MMKKVLYGVALTLFAGVSVGSLQSCKDDLTDVKTQTSLDLTKLRAQLTSESTRLEGLINAEATARQADIATVNRLIEGLQNVDEATARRIDGIDSRIDGIDALLENSYATKEYVDGQCEALKEELEALLKEYSDEGDAGLIEMIENAQKYAEWLDAALKDEIEVELDELRDEIVKISNAVESIIQHIDKQVTGILIQATSSPVFGDFSLPMGIRSSILFNWYGQNVHNEELQFPSASKTYSATAAVADLSKVAPATYYDVPAGYYGDAGESVTLGTVYTTLNPVGAKFDELVVNLETSAGNRLPWPVALTKSNREIKFGFTRDGEEESADNGFYEGELVVPVAEAISSDSNIEVEIEQGLKTAMKDAVKNLNTTTAKALVAAVYDQLSGKIPAYALRYDWNTPDIAFEVDPGFSQKSYSVLSQYDLAVATAKPLSYIFLADYPGHSPILPELGHIQNLLDKIKEEGGKLKFDLGGSFEIEDVTLNLGEIKLEGVDTDIKIDLSGAYIIVDNERYDVKMTEGFNAVEGLDKFQSSLEAALQKAFGDVATKLNTQVNEQIIGKINEQISKMFADINKEINGKIDDIIDSATSKLQPYFGKIDKAIDIYNKVANKINNFVANPNAYLQVTAFYSMGGANYGLVSGKASDPTPFVGNGDAFKLFLSSYTGELIVPACKKYVAITAAPEGVDLASVNTGDLNKVLDGNQVEISVAKPSVKGVYEFTYQALDYSGYTSTKKFYIEVK